MKDKLTLIAGGLLGLVFVVFGLNFFLHFIAIPPLPEGSPAAAFMGAAYTTGFLTFVKVLEILGGILVAIPKTRGLGLLVLGPIIVNILAFHIFIVGGGLFDPAIVIVTVLAAFLLWSERDAFCKLAIKQAD
jgi:hypothetical protein